MDIPKQKDELTKVNALIQHATFWMEKQEKFAVMSLMSLASDKLRAIAEVNDENVTQPTRGNNEPSNS